MKGRWRWTGATRGWSASSGRRTPASSSSSSTTRPRRAAAAPSAAYNAGMDTLSPARLDALRAEWTDQFVRVNPHSPELQRFGETVGRVVTVNWNGKALIDFQDGGW